MNQARPLRGLDSAPLPGCGQSTGLAGRHPVSVGLGRRSGVADCAM